MKTIFWGGVLVVGVLVVALIALEGFKRVGRAMHVVEAKAPESSGPPADLYRTTPIPSTNDSDLKFSVSGREKAVVLQNAETDLDMTVIRHSEYVIASGSTGDAEPPMSFTLAGQFQGEVRLSSQIVKGGKGLTVKFDPETVKGSDDKSRLTIRADPDADLGDVDVKLTATTPEGMTASVNVTLEVYKK